MMWKPRRLRRPIRVELLDSAETSLDDRDFGGEPSEALGDAPILEDVSQVKTWLSGIAVATSAVAADLRPMIVFSERPALPTAPAGTGEDEIRRRLGDGLPVSWIGGPSTQDIGEWPRNKDGAALAHIATFDLSDTVVAPVTAAAGLPDTGFLQIFHDLQTYGDDVGGATSAGWRVMWTDRNVANSRILEAPSDLQTPSSACRVLHPVRGVSVPSPEDHLGLAGFAGVEVVSQTWKFNWTQQRFAHPPHYQYIPYTHLMGHSTSGEDEPLTDILPNALPLRSPDDQHLLIADIESWTDLNGWFGDVQNLEMWMRRSDVETRTFENAWCLIRSQ